MSIELEITKSENKRIAVNPKDAEDIDVETGDLVIMVDEDADESCVGKVAVVSSIESGTVELDQVMIDTLSSDEGNAVTLERFEAELRELDRVTFGIIPLEGQDMNKALKTARKKEISLINFMNGRAITRGQKFIWEDENLMIEILGTQPQLRSGDVAIITKEILGGFDYKPSSTAIPFDGILLIDISGSMKRDDIQVMHVTQMVSHLKGGFTSPDVQSFLDRFQEGANVERCDAAALSALVYLSEKVGRGKGEKIGIIPFNASAGPIIFEGKNHYDAGSDLDIGMVAEKIVTSVRSAEGTTNLSSALIQAVEMLTDFGDEKIKMIVILTDGRPTKPDSEAKVVEVVEQYLLQRNDIVINAAGIGEDVDERLLLRIVNNCRGNYTRVTDLKLLVEWYADLARDLKMISTLEAVPDFVPDDVPGAEPEVSSDTSSPQEEAPSEPPEPVTEGQPEPQVESSPEAQEGGDDEVSE